MAIDQGTETVNVKTVDSTWRIEIYLEGATLLRFHRWLIKSDAATGEWISDPDRSEIPTVERTLAQVASKSYTAAGITATGNQILQLLNKMSDDERQADINAGNSPPSGNSPP